MADIFLYGASGAAQQDMAETQILNERDLKEGSQNKITRFLLVLVGGSQGTIKEDWPIINPEELLGRNLDCDIQFNDRSVSREHCKFNVNEGNLFVTDLGSTNSTKVNGSVIEPNMPTQLKDDDRIKVGNIVLRLLIDTVTECDWSS